MEKALPLEAIPPLCMRIGVYTLMYTLMYTPQEGAAIMATKKKKRRTKRIPLEVLPSVYDEIKAFADRREESVNGFLKRAAQKE